MNRPNLLAAAVLGVVGALPLATPSQADPITYTETATGTGCFGSGITTCTTPNFTNALVTITLTGDTNTVTNPVSGIFENIGAAGTVTLAVAGLGSATFTDQVAAFVNQSTTVNGQPASLAGFYDLGVGLDPLDTNNSAFASYNLQSFIGPIAGSPGLVAFNELFPTSAGEFVLTSASGTTFTAAAPAAVPAPGIGSDIFTGIGVFIGIQLVQRKARRSATHHPNLRAAARIRASTTASAA